jgi:hypothetical protein
MPFAGPETALAATIIHVIEESIVYEEWTLSKPPEAPRFFNDLRAA